jgi:hypothetical protein
MKIYIITFINEFGNKTTIFSKGFTKEEAKLRFIDDYELPEKVKITKCILAKDGDYGTLSEMPNPYIFKLFSILKRNNWIEPTKKEFPSYRDKNPSKKVWFEDIHFIWRNYDINSL